MESSQAVSFNTILQAISEPMVKKPMQKEKMPKDINKKRQTSPKAHYAPLQH